MDSPTALNEKVFQTLCTIGGLLSSDEVFWKRFTTLFSYLSNSPFNMHTLPWDMNYCNYLLKLANDPKKSKLTKAMNHLLDVLENVLKEKVTATIVLNMDYNVAVKTFGEVELKRQLELKLINLSGCNSLRVLEIAPGSLKVLAEIDRYGAVNLLNSRKQDFLISSITLEQVS
jgi:hypothetical protein